MKEYFCHRWPFYSIGKDIKFENGRFKTDDPGQIETIESNDKYMVFVWPVALPAVKEEVVVQVEEMPAVVEEDEERPTGPCAPLSDLEELVLKSGIVAETKPGKGRKGR